MHTQPGYKHELYHGRKATLPLNIAVVGCGLGGLAAAFCLGQAGHKVTVLESAPVIREIGAGIQLAPNLTRLLLRWGLGPKLKETGVTPQALTFRRYNNGERIGWTKLGDYMAQKHGAPYYHIHRADFHTMLFEIAAPFMTLRLNSRVVSLDPVTSTLTLESGEVVKADLIVGADGVNSTTREFVVDGREKPAPTGDAAYRAVIPAVELLKDPDLKELVDFPEMTGWIGPGRHIVAYCIRGGKEYNMVMCHPDDDSTELCTGDVLAEKMRTEYVGWEPRVQKLLSLIPTTVNWTLMDCAPLNTWIHQDGKLVLLGDACHPMLPYRAQGSAMAIEDAAVLGNLFSHLRDHSQITPLLHAYQRLRYVRTVETQASSRLNQTIFHFEDGPKQKARDESMRAAMHAARYGTQSDTRNDIGSANQWADEAKNEAQFSYDADREAERWWIEEGEQTVGML